VPGGAVCARTLIETNAVKTAAEIAHPSLRITKPPKTPREKEISVERMVAKAADRERSTVMDG